MSDLLVAFNKAGLIEKLDGDDERFIKIKSASDKLAESYSAEPNQLIRAVLAGLDPSISPDDPSICQAEEALAGEWPSFRSIHTDPPIFIYRAILLEACNQIAEGMNSAILWYTAADTLPLVKLGQEESIIADMLSSWANNAEDFLLVVPTTVKSKRAPVVSNLGKSEYKEVLVGEVDKSVIKKDITAASGPGTRSAPTPAIEGANQYWPNSGQVWSFDFTDRMTTLLVKQLNLIYEDSAENSNTVIKLLQELAEQNSTYINEHLKKQRSWIQEVVKQNEASRTAEHLRLNTLWWCEAQYSSSLCCSYRELTPILATAIMPIDLLDEIQTPASASVSYVLAETISKLPEAEFTQKYSLLEQLKKLSATEIQIIDKWGVDFIPPPEVGRISLRDLVISILVDHSSNLEQLVGRAGLDKDFEISLPQLAQAIFRQEQAVRLAEC